MEKQQSGGSKIDTLSPLIAGGITLLIMLPLIHFLWDKPWTVFIHPMIAYFACPCTHGRKRFILFSWGSLGSAVGWWGGMFIFSPFGILFVSGAVEVYLLQTTVGIVLFSFIFHKFFDAKNYRTEG